MQRTLSIFAFFSLLMASLHGFAQSSPLQKSDSLILQARTAKDDTNKVKLLNHIGDEFAYNDMKKARIYYVQALELSKKTGFYARHYPLLLQRGRTAEYGGKIRRHHAAAEAGR
ncbi:hypothetical protein [Mucilaginibacter pedocola]|uniref:Uncharacterized protein n=1 Tax=Mucilaginibacter pedocola TaxID=1792845 RepID=A0A1S9PL97_9SPHI|nr:hypothetical protein [Mucilaginibacter pedocola]OOQ61704.1 hypothetical protein BC343_01115 [Mucilaginibacter pedocola]